MKGLVRRAKLKKIFLWEASEKSGNEKVARKKGKKVEMKEEARGKKVCVCVVVANERKTKKVETRQTKVETRTRKKRTERVRPSCGGGMPGMASSPSTYCLIVQYPPFFNGNLPYALARRDKPRDHTSAG